MSYHTIHSGRRGKVTLGFCLVLAGLFLSSLLLLVQAAIESEGPNGPASAVNDTSIGTVSWLNPGYATNGPGGGERASVSLPGQGGTSHYLLAYDFGFAIPTNRIVIGITVEIQKEGQSIDIEDAAVRIVRGGAIGTADRSAGAWSMTETIVSYGGTNDQWGFSWTPEQINAADFGMAVSAVNTKANSSIRDAYINYIRITVHHTSTDEDNDGMLDSYETFVGLDPTTNDAAQDPDSDNLVNSQEHDRWTDPFMADTDYDNWSDAIDSNPVSRAVIVWADPQYTFGDDHVYLWPIWMGDDAHKHNGQWDTNEPVRWYVSSGDTNDCSVDINLDRTWLTNDLVMQLILRDYTNATMYVDLLDANEVLVTNNVAGNLLTGTLLTNSLLLDLPLVDNPDASVIRIRRETGEAGLYLSVLYIDVDKDGLDADQEAQLGSSDLLANSDGDALGDYDEVFTYGTDPALTDTDGDGLSDSDEIFVHGTDPLTDDSDGDGMTDLTEMLNGFDPTVSNVYSRIPFLENFETNTVVIGDLNGQNNWTAAPANVAMVQTSTVYAGEQALDIDTGTNMTRASAAQCFADPGRDEVWCDLYMMVRGSHLTDAPTSVVSFAFMDLGDQGQLKIYDGHSNQWVVLNNVLPVDYMSWARVTVKLDYDADEWLICLNGMIVGEQLGFNLTDRPEFSRLALSARRGQVDNLMITTNQPSALSLDWDFLLDEWEQTYFGDLDEVNTGDPDGDGLNNLGEQANSTDPTDTDSDDDLMDDNWEVNNGLDPLDDADAATDADGDGLSNLLEYQNNADPNDQDTDDDGVNDYDEVIVYGTEPDSFDLDTDEDGLTNDDEVNIYMTSPILADTDNDGTNDYYLVVALAGIDTVYRNGTWTEQGDVLVAASNWEQRVEYAVTVQEDGIYYLDWDLSNAVADVSAEFRMQLVIDGLRVDWLSASIPTNTNAALTVFTPHLAAGDHIIRLNWLNENDANKRLAIRGLAVRAFDAPDSDANGVQDWVEVVLAESGDSDADGLTDYAELFTNNTAVFVVDTDGDGLWDGEEIAVFGTDPTVSDTVLLDEQDGSEAALVEQIDLNFQWIWGEDDAILWSGRGTVWAWWDVVITHTGAYRFDVDVVNYAGDGDDDFEFVLTSSLNGYVLATNNIFGDLDLSGKLHQDLPILNPGVYRLGIYWPGDGSGNGMPAIRDSKLGIAKVRLYEIDAPDSDTNGIQDWAEAVLAASGDTDGDGISDYAEAFSNSTSIVNIDSDGDGLTDLDELTIYGTGPTDADSDDDGVNDGDEVLDSLTDPLFAEFDGTVTTVDSALGYETNGAAGDWTKISTEIQADRRRGFVEYELSCTESDVYRIQVRATHNNQKATCSPADPVSETELMLYIDGRYLGKRTLIAPDGVYGSVQMFTPWLTPGAHTVRVFWENVNSRVSLRVKEVRLQSLGGFDANTNGVKDWVEIYLSKVGYYDEAGSESVVSPACVEGVARFWDLMAMESTLTNNVTVQSGILGRWYADVPLASTGTTAVTTYWQSAAISHGTNITWIALDVLAATNDAVIRVDDSLKLAAVPGGATNGTVTIDIVGVTNYTTDIDTPVIHLFDSDGTFTVVGTHDDGQTVTSNQMDVVVVSALFPVTNAACMVGANRTWSCPGIPMTNAVLEADSTITLSGNNQSVGLYATKVNKDHYIVARLPDDGAILDGSKLDVFWVQGAVDGFIWVKDVYEGGEIWNQQMITKNLPATVDVWITISSSGVTFADDGTTARWIDYSDFDALGEYWFDLDRPDTKTGSVCHTIRTYQDGVYVGEAYYNHILDPEE